MPAPLSTTQLAALRAEERATMVDVCDIISRTRDSDNAGGYTYTEVVLADVPCRRTPNLAGDVETPFGGQLKSGLQWVFAFPYGTNITTDDEIVMGDERFSVMGVMGPRSYELTRRVLAMEK